MFKPLFPLLLLASVCTACKTPVAPSNTVETPDAASASVQTYIVSFSPAIGSNALEAYVAQKGYRIKYRYTRTSMLAIEVPVGEKHERIIQAFKAIEGVERVSVSRTQHLH